MTKSPMNCYPCRWTNLLPMSPAVHISHQCVLTQEALDRLQRPTLADGQRVSALRFGDPRVMALFQALCDSPICPAAFATTTCAPPSKHCSVARSPPPK